MVYSPISLYVALSMLTESSQDNPVLLKLLSGKSVENIRNINKEILSEQYKGKNGTTVFANSNSRLEELGRRGECRKVRAT